MRQVVQTRTTNVGNRVFGFRNVPQAAQPAAARTY